MMICCIISLSAVVAVTLLLLSFDNHRNKECDLYKGRWVYDESYPLYRNSCPFVWPAFNCAGNGRPDLQYQKYRWQPSNCNLPRWEGRVFVNRVKGKRIMFVGDSLSRNQWLSLACMIYAAYPTTSYKFKHPKITTLLSTIVFPDLKVTLLYQRNAFIVDIITQNGLRVLKLDSVATSSEQWQRADILIFDTWHWWLYTGRKQQSDKILTFFSFLYDFVPHNIFSRWDLIKYGNVTVKDMDRLEAYEKALKTWVSWVNQEVDAQNVQIFFQGVSPDHWNASEWGTSEMRRCGGEQEPLKQSMEDGDTNKSNIILKETLTGVTKPVHLLDINGLSAFRVDGHPSIYGNPRHIGMDCTHWCLPGVPDSWNQLLYATLNTS